MVKRRRESKQICQDALGERVRELEAKQVELETENKALRAAEQQRVSILDSITDGFVALDREWRYTYINAAADAIHGVPADRLLGRSLWEMFPDLVGGTFEQMFRRSAGEGVKVEFDAFYSPHGKWYRVRAFPSKQGLTICFHDITEQKAAEAERQRLQETVAGNAAALARSGSLLAEAQHLARIGSWNWDIRNDRVDWSDELYRIFGLKPQEGVMTYDRFKRYVHPDDRSVVDAVNEKAVCDHQPFEFTFRAQQRDGTMRIVLSRGEVVLGDAGKPVRMFGTTQDITERKEAEEALRASEERFRRYFELGLIGMAITSPTKGCMEVNDKICEILGYERSELLQKSWAELTHPDDLEADIAQFNRVLAGEIDGYSLDKRFIRKDGKIIDTTISVKCLRRADRAIDYFVALLQDITEQKRAEKVLRQQAEALEKTNRVKDDFLATLSHELRTPLNSILGWASLLLQRKQDPDTIARALEIIERSAKAQNRLIEDMLDLSRIIQGQLRLEINELEFSRIIREAIEAVRPAAEANQIALVVDLHPSADRLFGDINRLRQVVWNLLSNAIKFNSPGGRVEVRLVRMHSHVELQVKDNGRGIDPAFLPYIFDPFRQADSEASRSQGGLGLGLSIVRNLVELHGGSVRAESPGNGQGAAFTVLLPVRGAVRDRDQVGDRENRPPLPSASMKQYPMLDNVKVLIVDDQADSRELIQNILRSCNAAVTTAGSSREALEAFERSRPDLLISDIAMPDEDGYVLIQKLRALEKNRGNRVPAIALPAYAREEDRERALSAGYETHLPKPVEPEQLVRIVASLIGRATGNDG